MNNWHHPNAYRQNHWQHQGGPNHFHNAYRRITIEEAMHIALEQVPGQVVKIELDTENGIQVYEVDIVTAQGALFEVSVDINTGTIVEIEQDRI
ncbi:hypothetical protein CIL05_10185 [Virgibacillus profundi]|uniref:PepSY domain-containing protein n=1 Tax=Virgibacillus profundi TaxID=2024555 RepID=A0A2A2IDC7_9BACI|nr:PepSY domain-containing protein [Virgibacillus profundi]PAV29729.1 hypothetical protein CIL05_10185 [Virgibacillus profundi]PXY53900.1 peptidase [Virgibacillus profundi]